VPQVGYNIYVIPDDVLTIVLTFGVLDAAGARKKRAQLATKSGKEQMKPAPLPELRSRAPADRG